MKIEFLHYDSQVAGKFNLLTVVSYTISTFVFGYISSKINKRYVILSGTIGILFSAYPQSLYLKLLEVNVVKWGFFIENNSIFT